MPKPNDVLAENVCRLCGSTFPVTRAMVAQNRRDCEGLDGYEDMTDEAHVNIIEHCPTCSGVEV